MLQKLCDIKDASSLLCSSAYPGMSPPVSHGTNISVWKQETQVLSEAVFAISYQGISKSELWEVAWQSGKHVALEADRIASNLNIY